MITLYGIPNCDTVRKARRWLDQQGIAYRFHDFRRDGLDEARLRAWVVELGWETLPNRSGTTWRSAPDAVKAGLNAEAAIAFMLQAPASLIAGLLWQGAGAWTGFGPSVPFLCGAALALLAGILFIRLVK